MTPIDALLERVGVAIIGDSDILPMYRTDIRLALERELKPVLLLAQAKFEKHYECEDCFFSCPLAEDFCAGTVEAPTCTCGKAEWNRALKGGRDGE